MTEAMFLSREVDWLVLEPFQVLALRACAPNGIFTGTAKIAYLAQTVSAGIQELSELADCLFASDTDFLAKLPEKWLSLKPQLKVLMQLAKEKGIRR